MRAWRFLPLLILCCALDLAVPVAPTPGGVEFEDDEEVVQLQPLRDIKPGPREAGTGRRPDLRARVRPAAPAVSRAAEPRPVRHAHVAALDARSSDRAASPPPSSEDH
jgi:hypothetical protein